MGKFKDTVNANYYKQIADKIIQLLDESRNSPLSDKRWVWELMQNAKDIPNKFGRVSIELKLWPDKLEFSHNGDHFTDENLTCLIQQVSSKDSANEGEKKQTGKFGTGFITTHLLSNVVFVSGIVLNSNTNKYQHFELTLDRSARKSEDMIDGIKHNLEWVQKFDEDNAFDCPIAEEYPSRSEKDLYTKFTYPLSLDTVKSAQIGLSDLVNTLPITMVSLHEIKSVHVINYINGENQLYQCYNKTLEEDEFKTIVLSSVSINDENKQFLTYQVNKDGNPYLALSIEIKKENEALLLVKRKDDQPVLFRDFPLIGSEDFYFPYIINGFEFEPTQTRSGLFLNRNNEKPKKNRKILEDTILYALDFNNWLLSHNAKNTYLIASARVPKPEETYDEDVAKPWIEAQVASWRTKLLKQELLETKDGYATLKSIVIPDYGTKAANKKFYDFLKNFVKDGVLPLEEQHEAWAETLSWAKEQKYSKIDFFEDLQRVGNVKTLAERLGLTESETYEWLNQLFAFIAEQNDMNLLDKYPIVPNQYGNFCLLETLKTDSSKRIPDCLKPVYIPIIERDLKDELLSENIIDSVFGNITKYNIDALIQDANGIIEEKSKNTDYSELEEFTLHISKLISITSDTEANSDVRERIFKFVSEFVNLPSERQCVNNLPNSIWAEADKYILRIIPLIIDTFANGELNGIGSNVLIYPQAHSDEECVKWINEYVGLAKCYQMTVPTNKAIFPNQLGELCALENLHYDMNIPEEYKTLDKVATSDDIHYCLLDNRLEGYTSHNPISTTTLYERICKIFESGNVSDSKKYEIASMAFAIIPKTQSECTSDCQKIYELYKIYDPNIPEKTIVDGNGFYPEKFCVFMLRKLCFSIAQKVNVPELSEDISKDEKQTVEYVNDVIDYTENCFGKKYADIINKDSNGLWINQNNAFCLRKDVNIDKVVDEKLKELAQNSIVKIDFKDKLLKKGMSCEFFMPDSQTITTGDVLNDIDNAIQNYDKEGNSLQNSDCAKLIITLNTWIKVNHSYESYLKYFMAHREKLIVGSINDDKTLSVISTIVASPEKMTLLSEINKLPIDHIKKMVSGEYVVVTAEELAKYYSNIDINNLPKMEMYEDDSISIDEQIEYSIEAKEVVLKMLVDDGFDVCNKEENYTLINGVVKSDTEFPLVVKSYKNDSYQFRLNPNEWYQLMRSMHSMLLVYRGNGKVDKVSFSQLFRNQDRMSLHFSLDNFDNKTNISKFAEILKYFKGCKFDFGSLKSTRYETMACYQLGNNNPNAFIDFSSDSTSLLD